MLIYLLLFALLAFFPGWCLVRILAPRLVGFLMSFSASLALLMANVVIFVHFRIPLTTFTPVVIAEVLLLAAGAWLTAGIRHETKRALTHLRSAAAFHLGAGLTVAAASVHITWAGVYTEVPGDVWRHLGYIQWAYQSFEGSRSLLPVHPWYFIPAWLRQLAGGDVFTFVRGFGTANTLVQALGIYVFAYHVVRRFTASGRRAAAIACLAVLLSAFSIGVNVFSYLRYYAFGPMLQNMLVYFCCILLVMEIVDQRRLRPDTAAALAVLAPVLFLVHRQEAAFLYAFALALAAVIILRRALDWRRGESPLTPRLELYAAAGVLAATGVLFLITHYTLPIKGAVLPWIVPISDLFPTGIHLYVANPDYQVFRSITIWGVLVYLLFLFHWRTFAGDYYILSGMLIPLVTFLNPVFVDMFLRHTEAASIYRFAYAVPLHIVAACCLARCSDAVTRRGATRKLVSGLAALLLLALLLPRPLPGLHNPYSRLHTLVPVAAGNDYHQWRDLLTFLHTVDRTRVITDPVTAYLVRGLTRHRAEGHKFHQVFVSLDGGMDYYEAFTGALIVINERDGAPSANGRRAGHWPEDVLAVSRYYPASLKQLVQAHPGRFEPVWSRDRIGVYRIKAAP